MQPLELWHGPSLSSWRSWGHPGFRRDSLSWRCALDVLSDLVARERSYSYDEQAARALATIMAARRRTGREVSKPVDAVIAAVAASRGMALATRSTSDFADMGVELINPWDVH
jgi:predicted nucleic acid-binding protein